MSELYYLPVDVDENDNLYVKMPQVVERLKNAAAAFDAELMKNTRPVGRVP